MSLQIGVIELSDWVVYEGNMPGIVVGINKNLVTVLETNSGSLDTYLSEELHIVDGIFVEAANFLGEYVVRKLYQNFGKGKEFSFYEFVIKTQCNYERGKLGGFTLEI
jgi:hypothetical protein